MKRRILSMILVLAGALQAAVDPLREGRDALERGLPTIAAAKLAALNPSRLDAAARGARAILLARAQLASGHAATAAATLEALAAPFRVTANTPPEKFPTAARFWLAEAYAALGRPLEALSLYRASPAEFHPDAEIGAARMLAALDRRSEALAVLDEAGSGPSVAIERAALQLDDGQPVEALAQLAKIADAGAQEPRRAYLQARALMDLDRPSEAIRALDAIVRPDAILAANKARLKAKALAATGDQDAAETTLEAFIENNPAHPEMPNLFQALDSVYAAESAPSSSELRRWAEDDTHPKRAATALFYLGVNEARIGRADEAASAWNNLLSRSPQQPLASEARIRLAEFFLFSGNAKQALAILGDAPGGRLDFARGLALASRGDYAAAAVAFEKSHAETGWEGAAFNAALCRILNGDESPTPDAFPRRAEDLRLASALAAAGRRDPDAPDRLQAIADAGRAPWSDTARLALAEWDYLSLDLPSARDGLRRISSKDPPLVERQAALEVFLLDDGTADSEPAVAAAADAFLAAHPKGPLTPSIHLKRGEVLFRRGDYASAQADFEAAATAGGALAEKALFLAGQAAARSLSGNGTEEALDHYEEVARRNGSLALRARLAQALLLNALNRHEEAIPILDNILAANPDPDLKFAALIEKGDTFFQMAQNDAALYGEAIAAWRLAATDAPARWRNQALAKIGTASEKRGEIPAALSSYYDVISQPGDGEPEYFWFYKAGFDAARLLESQNKPSEAAAIYETLAARDGPRAQEARERLNTLRLENFLWDESPPRLPEETP